MMVKQKVLKMNKNLLKQEDLDLLSGSLLSFNIKNYNSDTDRIECHVYDLEDNYLRSLHNISDESWELINPEQLRKIDTENKEVKIKQKKDWKNVIKKSTGLSMRERQKKLIQNYANKQDKQDIINKKNIEKEFEKQKKLQKIKIDNTEWIDVNKI